MKTVCIGRGSMELPLGLGRGSPGYGNPGLLHPSPSNSATFLVPLLYTGSSTLVNKSHYRF